jgi:2-C-methyl-D-erythritol 4-phosphate cytidylyltransferase/2-C-methyl-D-erythritol 2,4-cyclodiphosphate synthase
MPKPERTAAILVAAGRGLRAGSGGPKQYRSIGGQTVIFRAMEPFCRHPQVFAVQPVLNPDDAAIFNEAVSALRYEPPADGGATRQASVHAGLEALAGQKPDVVLIHDAARPFVTAALISRAIDAAGRTGAAVPAIAVGCASRRRRRHFDLTSYSMPIAAPRARAAAISPTTPRWRNGRD